MVGFSRYILIHILLCDDACFRDSNRRWKTSLFIVQHFLFTNYDFLHVSDFSLFSNTSKTVFGTDHTWLCRELGVLSFDNKKKFVDRNNRHKMLKTLMCPFFLRHPLLGRRSLIYSNYALKSPIDALETIQKLVTNHPWTIFFRKFLDVHQSQD